MHVIPATDWFFQRRRPLKMQPLGAPDTKVDLLIPPEWLAMPNTTYFVYEPHMPVTLLSIYTLLILLHRNYIPQMQYYHHFFVDRPIILVMMSSSVQVAIALNYLMVNRICSISLYYFYNSFQLIWLIGIFQERNRSNVIVKTETKTKRINERFELIRFWIELYLITELRWHENHMENYNL